MKFDFCIGNPPYQEETDSDSTRKQPLYHFFFDSAFDIADKVMMISPARFLFEAGYTPKDWNKKMLNDKHFKVLYYEDLSEKIFPNTDIKGGVAITYRDKESDYGEIGTFTKYSELNSILKKVQKHTNKYLDSIIYSPLSFQLSELMLKENPNSIGRLRTSAFTTLSSVFYKEKPNNGREYISMIGLVGSKRESRFIRRDYLKDKSGTLDKYTLLLAKAVGSGEFGEQLSATIIAKPGIGFTQTFIAIGNYDTVEPIENIARYVKTKFARTMLGILKITQDCPAPKWKYVPLQDFTSNSDIDWSVSVEEIDQQLYKKYGLDAEEIAFIEENVKEMA